MLLRARFERHARGWSRKRAAESAGIDVRDLDDIEDDRRPDVVALRKLASVYGFSADVAHVLLKEVPPALDPEARRAGVEAGFAGRTDPIGDRVKARRLASARPKSQVPSPPSLSEAIRKERG